MKVTLWTLVLLILAAAAAWLLPAQAAGLDRCPNQPEVLKTAKGAHARAAKGWNADKVKKDRKTIARVRTQARCAPSKRGRKHVREVIAHAKKRYKRARADKLYDSITSSPGQARLAVLRQCESTNRYNDPSAPAGAYGMLAGWGESLQYYVGKGADPRSKKWVKLTGDGPTSPPYRASKREQDIRASLLYQHGGWWECDF